MTYPRLTACLPNECRHDVFHGMHKALRMGHCAMVTALGSHDFRDSARTRDLLARLKDMLALGRLHVEGEAREIFAAFGARWPEAAARTRADEAGRSHAAAEIESLMRSVEVATPARRPIAGHALYRCYALFAAADMEQMNGEETELLSLLHACFSDEELAEMESRILARLSDGEIAALVRLQMQAFNQVERAAALSKLKAVLAPQDFETVLAESVRPVLDSADFDHLAAEIGARRAA